MEIFRCTVCGHEYDPRKGEIIQGVEPNTPFEELPRDWTCPVCGAVKDAFRKVTE